MILTHLVDKYQLRPVKKGGGRGHRGCGAIYWYENTTDYRFDSKTRKPIQLRVEIRVEVLRPGIWADTSIFTDHLISGWTLRYMSVAPGAIPPDEFAERYGDVPYALADEFIFLHELGHCRSIHEEVADAWAFASLGRVPQPEWEDRRRAWYEKGRAAAARHPILGEIFNVKTLQSLTR